MEKKDILEKLKELRKNSKKRKFSQSVDFSIVLKDVNLKDPEQRIDEFYILPNKPGENIKICALVDKDLSTQAKEVCDKVILKDDFSEWDGKSREIKKLADEYDYFIAQATIMSEIAKTFGKFFGPKGKMPNPKSGSIVPPNKDLKPVVERLKKTVNIKAKKQPVLSARVGTEETTDEKIAENVFYIYENIVRKLPRKEQQIKKKTIKFTMSKPVVL